MGCSDCKTEGERGASWSSSLVKESSGYWRDMMCYFVVYVQICRLYSTNAMVYPRSHTTEMKIPFVAHKCCFSPFQKWPFPAHDRPTTVVLQWLFLRDRSVDCFSLPNSGGIDNCSTVKQHNGKRRRNTSIPLRLLPECCHQKWVSIQYRGEVTIYALINEVVLHR